MYVVGSFWLVHSLEHLGDIRNIKVVARIWTFYSVIIVIWRE